jgi:hypothetical protein
MWGSASTDNQSIRPDRVLLLLIIGLGARFKLKGMERQLRETSHAPNICFVFSRAMAELLHQFFFFLFFVFSKASLVFGAYFSTEILDDLP